MQQFNEPYVIHIPVTQFSEVFTLKDHVHEVRHVKIIIEPNASATIVDSSIQCIEHIEIMMGAGSTLFWVSDCVHADLLINCQAHSRVYYVQVVGKAITAARQHLALSMQESAQATVRIFPFLKDDQKFECSTLQQHDSSITQSDLHIVGQVGGDAQFGHTSMIAVKTSLAFVGIVQKTIIFLSGSHVSAYARPSFDIASKDVHCTHGASLGAVDENQLWYLQARGIDWHEAMHLIIRFRCLACLEKQIPQHLFELINSMIVATHEPFR